MLRKNKSSTWLILVHHKFTATNKWIQILNVKLGSHCTYIFLTRLFCKVIEKEYNFILLFDKLYLKQLDIVLSSRPIISELVL